MATMHATVDGKEIVIKTNSLTGKQVVTYEGQVVSKKRNLSRFTAVHSFIVRSDEMDDLYEVNVFTGYGRPGYAIRKNGLIQAHHP